MKKERQGERLKDCEVGKGRALSKSRLAAATSKPCSSSSLLSHKKKKKSKAKAVDKPVKPVKHKRGEETGEDPALSKPS